MTYHFVLVDTATSTHSTTVPRGNAFERAVLRAFGLKTEKLIADRFCQERVPPKNEVKITDGGLEIWIYGRARCLQILVAKR